MSDALRSLVFTIKPTFQGRSGTAWASKTVSGGITATYALNTATYISLAATIGGKLEATTDIPINNQANALNIPLHSTPSWVLRSRILKTKFETASGSAWTSRSVTGGITATYALRTGDYSGESAVWNSAVAMNSGSWALLASLMLHPHFGLLHTPVANLASFTCGISFSNLFGGSVAFGGAFESDIVLSNSFIGFRQVFGAFESDIVFSNALAGSAIFQGSFESDIVFSNVFSGSAILGGQFECDIIFGGLFIGPLNGTGILCLVSNGTPFLIPIAGPVVDNNYVF